MFKFFKASRDLVKLREYMNQYHTRWYWDGENVAANTVMAFDAIRAELKEREQEVINLKQRLAEANRPLRGPAWTKPEETPPVDPGRGNAFPELRGVTREELVALHEAAIKTARENGATEEEIAAVALVDSIPLRDDDPVHVDDTEYEVNPVTGSVNGQMQNYARFEKN